MRRVIDLAQRLIPRSIRDFRIFPALLLTALVTSPTLLAAQEATPGATPVAIPTVGETTLIAGFDGAAGEFTEGVTVGRDGTVFVSVSPLGQLARVNEDGTHEIVGQVEGLQAGDMGMLGVTAHEDGSIYGAVFSANPEANGVWRFDVDNGAVERVPGTEQMTMSNAVAFAQDGTMYVTDTIGGAVWVVPMDGTAESWIQHEMLAGSGDMGLGIPIGANGIALDQDAGVIYVAVLEQGTIVAIPVMDDGSAGEPIVHARFEGLALPDGLAIGEDGTLYAAQPAINTISRVTTDGTVEIVASGGDLDGPASVAVGPEGDVLYAANFSAALAGIVPPERRRVRSGDDLVGGLIAHPFRHARAGSRGSPGSGG